MNDDGGIVCKPEGGRLECGFTPEPIFLDDMPMPSVGMPSQFTAQRPSSFSSCNSATAYRPAGRFVHVPSGLREESNEIFICRKLCLESSGNPLAWLKSDSKSCPGNCVALPPGCATAIEHIHAGACKGQQVSTGRLLRILPGAMA